jgi:hypothetical protein
LGTWIYLPPPLQRTFDIFCIHLIFMKYQQFLTNKLLCRFASIDHHSKNVQTPIFIKYISKGNFNLKQWMQDFKNIGNKDFLSSFSVMATPCSQPIKEKINFKLGKFSNLSPSIFSFMNTSYPSFRNFFFIFRIC